MEPISPLVAAAHELKTPLALIGGLSDTLLDSSEELSPRQREYLERILLSSERMVRVVQGLVDAYRVDQTTFDLQLEPVHVGRVVEEVAHELTPLGHKLCQDIRIRVSRRTNMVVANRLLLGEALCNLVDNALRHGQGKAVTIAARGRHEFTRFSVAHDGLRLNETEFRQLERRLGGEPQPLNAQGGSSGLGLYIVRQLAQAMGGRIGLERPARGTSMYLDLHTSTQLSFL